MKAKVIKTEEEYRQKKRKAKKKALSWLEALQRQSAD